VDHLWGEFQKRSLGIVLFPKKQGKGEVPKFQGTLNWNQGRQVPIKHFKKPLFNWKIWDTFLGIFRGCSRKVLLPRNV